MSSYFSKQSNLNTSQNDINSKCDIIKTESDSLKIKRRLMQSVIVKTFIDNNFQNKLSTDEYNVLIKKLTDETLLMCNDKK